MTKKGNSEIATRQFLVGLILTTDLAAHPEKDRSS